MILYDNRDTFRIFRQQTGSVVRSWRVLLPAIASTIICGLVIGFPEAKPELLVSASVARIYASILGFVIVFRTNTAFSRYFEGIHYVQLTFSTWRDAAASLQSFVESSSQVFEQKGNAEAVGELANLKARLLHWFTLLTASAVETLKDGSDNLIDGMHCNWEPVNRVEWQRKGVRGKADSEDSIDQVPPDVAVAGVSNKQSLLLNRMTRGSLTSQQVFDRHSPSLFIIDSEEDLMDDGPNRQSPDLPCSVPDRGSLGVLSRGSLEVLNEDEGEEMRPTASKANDFIAPTMSGGGMSKSISNKKKDLERHCTASFAPSDMLDHVRLLPISSKTLLDKAEETLLTASQVIGCITDQEEQQFEKAHDHVSLVLSWILGEISSQSLSGNMLIPPPILTRVYLELSNGMQYFNQAMKLVLVPFPFPFAQVIQYALAAFIVLCPFAGLEMFDRDVPVKLDKTWLVLLVNFIVCTGYFALNEICSDVETMFGSGQNEYPVYQQQWMVTWAIEDCYFNTAPKDFDLDTFGFNVAQEMKNVVHQSVSINSWSRRPDKPVVLPESDVEDSSDSSDEEEEQRGEAEPVATAAAAKPPPDKTDGQVTAMAAALQDLCNSITFAAEDAERLSHSNVREEYQRRLQALPSKILELTAMQKATAAHAQAHAPRRFPPLPTEAAPCRGVDTPTGPPPGLMMEVDWDRQLPSPLARPQSSPECGISNPNGKEGIVYV